MNADFFATYAKVERHHWWFRARREIVLAVMRQEVAKGCQVLDIGCGTGFVLEGLQQHYHAWGLEPSQSALDECRARGVRDVWPGSPDDLSAVEGRRFDAVLFLDVLEHLDDDRAALRRAYELLVPGGLVLVTVPAFEFLWSAHDVANQHRRRYTRDQLAKVVRDSGFTVEQAGYFNMYLFPVALVQRWTSRLFGTSAASGLWVPPEPVNRLMQRIFEWDKGALLNGKRRGLPFGVSLLAIGRRENA